MEEININEILIELNVITKEIINLYDDINSKRYRGLNCDNIILKLRDLIKKENELISIFPEEKIEICLYYLESTLSASNEEDEADSYQNNLNYSIEEENVDDEDICDDEELEEESINLTLKYNDIEIIERMYSKFLQILEIQNGKVIFTESLDCDCSYIKALSVEDAIESIINIETIKKLKYKIETTHPYPTSLSSKIYENDLKFIKHLKEELICLEIKNLKSCFTMEVLSTLTNTSINNIPDDTLDIIKHEIYTNYSDRFIYLIEFYFKDTINKLSYINWVLNDDFYVFEYLELLTKLEILFSYIDNNTFKQIKEYFNLKKFQNNGIKSRVANIFNNFKNNGYTKKLGL